MSSDAPRLYWDSCVFVSLISGDPTRVPTIKDLMQKAQESKVEIFTSVFTIAEVGFATYEKVEQKVDPEVEGLIRALWRPLTPVTLVEFHQFIAEESRLLMRAGLEKGWTGLKGKDAVHLATAKLIGVGEFHTYDPKLEKYSEMIGAKICEPYVVQTSFDLTVSSSSSPPASPT